MMPLDPFANPTMWVDQRIIMQEQVNPPGRIVAVGLLTEQDLSVLGQGFRRVYRLDDHHDFADVLARIDAAELLNEGAEKR